MGAAPDGQRPRISAARLSTDEMEKDMTANSYPLEWPEGWERTQYHLRKSGSQFKTSFDRARRDLLDELRKLGADNVVISSWLPIRRDGQPYADQARRRLEDPGVAVYFTLRGRQMVMARDAFTSVHDNLRSIGLGIEHLRGLERHGGGTMMERAFAGFAALEAPGTFDALAVLGLKTGATREEIEAKFREMAKRHHPDRGGDSDEFVRIERARAAALAGL